MNPFLQIQSVINVVKEKLQNMEVTKQSMKKSTTIGEKQKVLRQQNKYLKSNLKSMSDNISTLITRLNQEDLKNRRNALHQGNYSLMYGSRKRSIQSSLKSNRSPTNGSQVALNQLADREQEIDEGKVKNLIKEKNKLQNRLVEISHPDFMKNLLIKKEKTERQLQ